MNTRSFVALMLALSATPLFPADFWEKKKFTDWSAKEVQKILTDSPWARPVLVPLESQYGGQTTTAQRPRKTERSCDQCAVGGAPTAIQSSTMPELARPLTVTVRWHSALPLKQALARLRFGDEVGTSAAAAEMLAQGDESYVVGISLLPRELLPENQQSLKAGAVLKVRNGPSIPAQEVRVRPEGDMVSLLLFFPRTVEGASGITVEHREIELGVKLRAVEIKRKFKLSEMLYQGKLEL